MDELKRVMDAFSPLDTPAYQRTLVERPGYREFGDAKWAALSRAMWVTMSIEIRDQPDQLAELAAVHCPTLVLVGDRGRAVPSACRSEMAATIPGAELVVIPDAGHSPQFENGAAWLDGAPRLPRPRRRRPRPRSDPPGAVAPTRSVRRCRRRAAGSAPAPPRRV